ncbi:MAG TPA: TetR family transcriptional regulator [Roseiflexaceae bacterium]|nr:TetR family transcriptional regulator [Roseiflexaceae bacterium]
MPGKKASEAERREQILRAARRVAMRDRLDGLTIRNVAREAEVSSGLVFFHYSTKDALLEALLEWLLERTIVAEIGPDILRHETAVEQLLALLEQELQRLSMHRDQLELFFDFWVIGRRDTTIRTMISQALDRYRASFRPFAAAVIAQNPERYADMTAEGLALLVVSVIQGCAIQVIKDPNPIDLKPMLQTVYALLGRSDAVEV